ncbi:MAG TPA: hypothetical protein VN618_12165 [Solirubrobacteraceae bacterium]|nr:hypothetical protein [Solirubrobacteraceae bacterium]
MSKRARLAILLALAGLGPATEAQALTLQIAPRPTVRAPVEVSFSAPALPEGGYYYAVVVLRPYRGFTRELQPSCSTSSEMQRTDYGYPSADGRVGLTLAPAKSDTRRWCPGGAYEGALYAVPHAPPCESRYPCRESEPYEPSPCFGVEGHRVCGVVALRTWRYPSPLPEPLASGTATLARFSVAFPTRVSRTLHLAATIYGVDETLLGKVTSHEALRRAGKPAGQVFSACEPLEEGQTAHCTARYRLRGGTLSLAGAVAVGDRTQTLTITGGTGRYRGAEGSLLSERDRSGTHARETLAIEGPAGR